jgi:transposase-like protein
VPALLINPANLPALRARYNAGGVTQAALAAELGVSRRALGNWLTRDATSRAVAKANKATGTGRGVKLSASQERGAQAACRRVAAGNGRYVDVARSLGVSEATLRKFRGRWAGEAV